MKRLIALLVSLGLLAWIYLQIDVARLVAVFAGCDRAWLALAVGMLVPLTLLTAWRLELMMPRGVRLGLVESTGLILAASVLNLVLPSKMGDLAKAWFLRDRGALDGNLAFSLVVFEKTCDLLALLAWCLFGLVQLRDRGWIAGGAGAVVLGALAAGLLLIGSRRTADAGFGLVRRLAPSGVGRRVGALQEAWTEMHGYFWRRRAKLAGVVGVSLALWFLHMLQIWLFIVALRASVPFLTSLALSPLAILAGLVPLTFAGVGTRDAALIALYAPYFAASTGAALGLLCTSRYLLPALLGLPFLRRYGLGAVEAARS